MGTKDLATEVRERVVATGSKSSRFEKRAKRTCRGRVVATVSMVDRLVRDGGARLKKENLAEWRGERRDRKSVV